MHEYWITLTNMTETDCIAASERVAQKCTDYDPCP